MSETFFEKSDLNNFIFHGNPNFADELFLDFFK